LDLAVHPAEKKARDQQGQKERCAPLAMLSPVSLVSDHVTHFVLSPSLFRMVPPFGRLRADAGISILR
jgi:hypothetical protein